MGGSQKNEKHTWTPMSNKHPQIHMNSSEFHRLLQPNSSAWDTQCLKNCLLRIGCIQVVFTKTKRSNPGKTWSITKGASIPQTFLHQNACPEICNHLGLSILGLSPHWKNPTKSPNNTSDLRWSAFMSLRQVNPEFTQNKEKVVNPRAHPLLGLFSSNLLARKCNPTQS